MKQATRLFVDFDGTITKHDIGDSIFETFLLPDLLRQGWHTKIIDEWKAGTISSHECLVRECANTRVTREELDRHLDKYGLTPGFKETVGYCKANGIPLMILSDGLDYYIEYLLGKFGLSEVDYRANSMFFTDGSIGVEFPYMDRGCGRCGNCKRWHMVNSRKNGETVVYVGDGYSDRYAIRNADRVFARGDLVEYCGKNGLSYTPYKDFYDIMRYLENGDE
ncbi:MtnX-like HAD-IB family phosphatase [bacterium]|nr:MtnX-like HAD-IB family phosphatase [bacterium]